jgi:hypothetical protein
VLAIIVLAACSGGGSSHMVPAPVSSTNSVKTSTSTTLKISIPQASSTAGALRRTPAYISASTQSFTIDVRPQGSSTSVSGFPMTANLTPSSPGCTTVSNATVCTIGLVLAPGNYKATLATFDGIGGTGNVLSTGQSLTLDVVLNQANLIPLALGGVLASIQVAPSGGQLTAGYGFVDNLTGNGTGTLSAYGVDIDGNTIVGAGSPAVSAASDAPAQIAVTQPTVTNANAIGLASLSSSAIAHITVTVTPAASTGSTAISQTVAVQAPTMNLLYLASYGGRIRVFDQTATEVTRAGTAFDSVTNATGMIYDPTNQLLYVAIQASPGPSYVLAFDRNGNAVPLNAGATGLNTVGQLAYDSVNGWIYATNQNFALDAAGNQHALTQTLNLEGLYAFTYDPVDNLLLQGTQLYTPSGVSQSVLPFAGNVGCETFNPVNDYFYVATFSPSSVTAYNTSGSPQALSGSFATTYGSLAEDPDVLAADPSTGNIYMTTNRYFTYGYDRNGNLLPPPWHTIAAGTTGAGGLLLVPSQ